MNRMSWSRHQVFALVTAGIAAYVSCFPNQPALAQQTEPPKLGSALLDALDTPDAELQRMRKNVPAGSRGIVQRSRLDFGDAQSSIQLAFVIDATQSMADDIDDLADSMGRIVEKIRQIVQRKRGTDRVYIEVAVVIYRDILWQNEQGQYVEVDPVEIPSRNFVDCTTNPDRLRELLKKIDKRSGVPAYPEQVDRGIHAALTQLAWDLGQDVTRMMVVAGDAPPWDQDKYLAPGTTPRWQGLEDSTTTLRGYSDQALIALAEEKGVVISSVRCNTGFTSNPDIEEMRDEFLTFLRTLAGATDGQFVDLFDSNTINALATKTTGVRLQELDPITTDELNQHRKDETLQVAVLPPLPLDRMKFYGHPANRVSGALLLMLQEIDDQSVLDGYTVERGWHRLAAAMKGREDNQILADLAKQIGANLLIWGSYTEDSYDLDYTCKVFNSQGGQIASVGPITAESASDLTHKTVTALVAEMSAVGTDQNPEARLFASLYHRLPREEILLRRSVDNDEAYDNLIIGRNRLEQAAGILRDQDDSEANKLTLEAQSSLRKVQQAEPNNPLALLLLSNCELNLGHRDRAKSLLSQAYAHRPTNEGEQRGLQWEIEADYAVFVENDPVRAIELYNKLIDDPELTRSRAALRAHWMRSGLLLGDWNAAERVMLAYPDEDKRLKLARESILMTMTRWPDSPEAQFYLKQVEPPLERRSVPGGNWEWVGIGVEHRIAVPQSGRMKVATNR